MYCNKCGRENEEDNIFCEYCGAKLAEEDDTESCYIDGEEANDESADDQEMTGTSRDSDGHDEEGNTEQADTEAARENISFDEEDDDENKVVIIDGSIDEDDVTSETSDSDTELNCEESSESEKNVADTDSGNVDESTADKDNSSDTEESGGKEPESEKAGLVADSDIVYVIGKVPSGKAESVTESIDSRDTEPGTGSRKKKKIIITCIVIFIVLAACAAALVLSFEHKASAEYKAAVKSADIYMKKSNYKKAAVKYLEAIDAKPAEQDAYVRLADVYMKQKESGKAVKILEKGEANAKKKTKIKEKLQYVKVYDTYCSYVDEDILQGTDIVYEKNTTSSSEDSSGLVSALLKDCDGDSVPEMITAELYNDEEPELVLSYYKCSGDKVENTDQVNISLGKSSLIARKCSVFLKNYKDKWYMAVSFQGVYIDSVYNNMYIYDLSDGNMKQVRLLHQESNIQGGTYDIDGDSVGGYDTSSYDFEEDYEEYQRLLESANAAGQEEFKKELEKYGLSEKVNECIPLIKRLFEGADESDETEAGICFIQYGVYYDDQIDIEKSDRLYIEDLTNMTDMILTDNRG